MLIRNADSIIGETDRRLEGIARKLPLLFLGEVSRFSRDGEVGPRSFARKIVGGNYSGLMIVVFRKQVRDLGGHAIWF